MRFNRFYQLPYIVIDLVLNSDLNKGALLVLLFAMKADQGNHRLGKDRDKALKLGIDRVVTGTKCGKKTVIDGLRVLVEKGFLEKVDNVGSYRLGRMFDEHIPVEEVVSVGDKENREEPPQSRLEPQQYAEELFTVWNDIKALDNERETLDNEARENAEAWVSRRIKVGGNPAIDFRTSLEYFLAHGHEHPLKDGTVRDPGAYPFKGFIKICDMFFNHAIQATAKKVAQEPINPSREVVPVALPVAKAHNESLPTASSSITDWYSSFITGTDAESKPIYRQGKINSVDELTLVYEYSFEQLGMRAKVRGDKSAEQKCAEDFADMSSWIDIDGVVSLVAIAKKISEKDPYFITKPFIYHTARTVFPKALEIVREGVLERAKEQKKLETGELKQDYIEDLRLRLSFIACYHAQDRDYEIPTPLTHLYRIVENWVRDYGRPSQNDLPNDIIDGLRSLFKLGVITIPETLSDAVGSEPWEINFEWQKEYGNKLMDIWRRQLVDDTDKSNSTVTDESTGGGEQVL